MDHPIRILHLEDNSRDAQLIHDLLDDAGLPCAIVRAINRPTFESALAQDSFDLILCDNNLPDYDGKAALALARARQPLTPVVIISGSLGEDEAVRSLQFGATDYLLKGRLERLIPAVRRALDEARERRQLQEAELELRRSEERMRLALAATNDAIWDWDLLAGTIVCNSTFEEAFGRPAPNSDVAAWWNDRVAPEEREDVSATLAAAIETAVPFWTKTYCLRRRDGRWAHVNNRVCLSTDATGRVVRLVGALQDITEAMEAEDQRNALEDQLRQAQKLEAIGTLAGGIAHDFNNILGIILANSDLARMDLVKLASTDHSIGESLGEITLAANRARDLVRQILTFSRRTDSTLSVMKVQPIVRECLKMLRSTIPPIVTIKQSVDPACACIVGDPTQLHQVVMNLCTNAWHALPARDGLIDLHDADVDHLSRSGPLGTLGLLFTPTAMIVAQIILVTPIVAALTRQVIEDLWKEYEEQLRSLGAGPARAVTTLMWDGRFSLLTAVLAGFGRASAEVGAVMMVGGNIDHVTRVMTTTIALEVAKGDLALALGLGVILIALSTAINGAAYMVKEAAQKRYG